MTDNLCDNSLDLANGILNVENNLPYGTYCQWLISAQDNNGHVILEFQNFNVRNAIAFKKYLIMLIAIYQKIFLDRGMVQ